MTPNRFHAVTLSTAASTIALFGLIGCRRGEPDSEQSLNWKQVQGALEAKEVLTVSDLFVRLSTLPVKKAKEFFSDIKARESEFEPLDKYMSDYFQLDHLEKPEMRKRIAARLTWKKPGGSVVEATRVYTIYTVRPTQAEQVMTWGVPLYFQVFTDDSGTIIGWIKPDTNIKF